MERLSIELTNRCAKACWFCYNASGPGGGTRWTPTELVDFVRDCAAHGVKAVSFGGGEPLQYEGLFDVLRQVHGLAARGIRSGINLLVARSNLEAARRAAEAVRASGIGNERIVYLPMRGQDTPTPAEVASVAGGRPFQSMSCLMACGPSPRFCSIGWDRMVAWCSYTRTRAPLTALTYKALDKALTGLGLEFCGGTDGQ